jgi:N-acetylmuramoyl-L-alanine amidase
MRIKIILISLLVIIFLPVMVIAEETPVRLIIDGHEISEMSAPPIIVDGRTLVPFREVFQHVGGTVGWHSGHRQVSLFYGDDVLVMTIDEIIANLNGSFIEMHTAPIIHDDRTMVPLRFPSEIFGFDVAWDSEKRAAIVNTPNGEHVPVFRELPEEIELPPPGVVAQRENIGLARDVSPAHIQTISHEQTTVTELRTPRETGTAAYIVVASSEISEVQYFLLPDNRLVVDIHNAVSLISGDFYAPQNIPVTGVRASQFSQTPRVTRVVFDVVGEAEYSISLSADRRLLTISFSQNRISGVFSQSDALSDSLFIQGDIPPAINISTEGFPQFITLNIDNAKMDAVSGIFDGGVFALSFETGQNADGSAYVRVYVKDEWPSFSLAYSANSAVFMMHHGVSGVRYDSVNRELRISRSFEMDIQAIHQISDYLRFRHTFVLPPAAEVLGRGEISVPDGFVNSVELTHDALGNVNLTFNTARVLTFSVHEEPNYYVIRAHLPREVSPFIVVIDPGHGGSQPGSIQNGIVEKELAIEVSHMVMQLLDADPFITAFMTRRDDTFVSLLNRAEFANEIGANLFVSIHANAAEISRGVPNPDVHGIETWFNVGEIEAAVNRRFTSSHFADIMQKNLIQATSANDRGTKNDIFVVLRETNMPSVLVEMGFLTNPQEAARLATTEYQWTLARAIYQGIVDAFAS